jgi:hypothetical protein
MPDLRIPRGFGKVSYPFRKRYENGQTPSYPFRPATFLPVWSVDETHDDPIVIPPGTLVGILNETDHAGIGTAFNAVDRKVGGWIVPACPVAYTVTYSSNDLVNTKWGGTPDLDEAAGNVIVVAAGASSATVAPVKPLGIAMQPLFAGWMDARWENYQRQLLATWRSGNWIVTLPCLTAGEAAIQPGDLVMMDDSSSPDWDPGNLYTTTPGRLQAFNGGSYSADQEYIVGRCTKKTRLGKQASTSAGQQLLTAIGTGAPQTLTNINTAAAYLWPPGENFKIESKTETVPGLQLSASSQTLGRPAELLWANADANGDFWAIDVLLRV